MFAMFNSQDRSSPPKAGGTVSLARNTLTWEKRRRYSSRRQIKKVNKKVEMGSDNRNGNGNWSNNGTYACRFFSRNVRILAPLFGICHLPLYNRNGNQKSDQAALTTHDHSHTVSNYSPSSISGSSSNTQLPQSLSAVSAKAQTKHNDTPPTDKRFKPTHPALPQPETRTSLTKTNSINPTPVHQPKTHQTRYPTPLPPSPPTKSLPSQHEHIYHSDKPDTRLDYYPPLQRQRIDRSTLRRDINEPLPPAPLPSVARPLLLEIRGGRRLKEPSLSSSSSSPPPPPRPMVVRHVVSPGPSQDGDNGYYVGHRQTAAQGQSYQGLAKGLAISGHPQTENRNRNRSQSQPLVRQPYTLESRAVSGSGSTPASAAASAPGATATTAAAGSDTRETQVTMSSYTSTSQGESSSSAPVANSSKAFPRNLKTSGNRHDRDSRNYGSGRNSNSYATISVHPRGQSLKRRSKAAFISSFSRFNTRSIFPLIGSYEASKSTSPPTRNQAPANPPALISLPILESASPTKSMHKNAHSRPHPVLARSQQTMQASTLTKVKEQDEDDHIKRQTMDQAPIRRAATTFVNFSHKRSRSRNEKTSTNADDPFSRMPQIMGEPRRFHTQARLTRQQSRPDLGINRDGDFWETNVDGSPPVGHELRALEPIKQSIDCDQEHEAEELPAVCDEVPENVDYCSPAADINRPVPPDHSKHRNRSHTVSSNKSNCLNNIGLLDLTTHRHIILPSNPNSPLRSIPLHSGVKLEDLCQYHRARQGLGIANEDGAPQEKEAGGDQKPNSSQTLHESDDWRSKLDARRLDLMNDQEPNAYKEPIVVDKGNAFSKGISIFNEWNIDFSRSPPSPPPGLSSPSSSPSSSSTSTLQFQQISEQDDVADNQSKLSAAESDKYASEELLSSATFSQPSHTWTPPASSYSLPPTDCNIVVESSTTTCSNRSTLESPVLQPLPATFGRQSQGADSVIPGHSSSSLAFPRLYPLLKLDIVDANADDFGDNKDDSCSLSLPPLILPSPNLIWGGRFV